MLERRRSPAVSVKMNLPYWLSTGVSMASRVVPASSATIIRFSPKMRLVRLDLPTLGRPMMATGMRSSSTTVSEKSRWAQTASSRSPVPWPWTADTGITSSKPRL